MKFVTGGIVHETHTFSAEDTPLEAFDQFRGEELHQFEGSNHSVGGVIRGCAAAQVTLAPTLFASAVPSGTPSQATFEALVDELVERIADAMPADGIVLTLHGAMVAEGYPDAESEIARRVRAAVGTEIPLAITLDYHANIGQSMVDDATIITTYDTYPHIDAADRASEAVDLLHRTVLEEISPSMALSKPPLIPVPQAQFTEESPFRDIFERAHQIERGGEALTITIAAGFPYADIQEAGTSVVVTTDSDPDQARSLATELATMAWDRRQEMVVQNTPPAEAVSRAIASSVFPFVLVDVADNIGGGTPGDGTVLLEELLRQGALEATVFIADPEAAQEAIERGIGGQFSGEVGGKVDDLHGSPLPITGIVSNITDGKWVHEGPENAGVPVDMGPTALVRTGGVNLVLTSRKCMPGDLQQLRSVGIDPEQQRILVVKAAVRWRGGYEPITRDYLLVDTPGLGSANLGNFEFLNIRRPIFPIDPEATWAG